MAHLGCWRLCDAEPGTRADVLLKANLEAQVLTAASFSQNISVLAMSHSPLVCLQVIGCHWRRKLPVYNFQLSGSIVRQDTVFFGISTYDVETRLKGFSPCKPFRPGKRELKKSLFLLCLTHWPPDVFENFLLLSEWVRNCSLHEWMQKNTRKAENKIQIKHGWAQDKKLTRGYCE